MDSYGPKTSCTLSSIPLQALSQPVTSLVGVTPKAAGVLWDTLGIVTVQDLASSGIFSVARAIEEATRAAGPGNGKQTPALPTDLLDRTVQSVPIEQIAAKPVSIFTSIGKKRAANIESELGVTTVGELALWQPYREARALLTRAYGNGFTEGYDPEAPSDLIPANGTYPTERVQYEVLLFDEFVGGTSHSLTKTETKYMPVPDASDIVASEKWEKIKIILGESATRPLGSDGPLDITDFLGGEQGYERPAIGGVLTFTQSWYGQGLALGTLIHSVALAPGESTKIAMLDWTRTSRASTTEEIGESESLYSSVARSRAISEITSSVARETQEGKSGASSHADSSQSGGATGGSTYGFRNNDWFSSVGGFISNLMNDTPQTTTTGTSWGAASNNASATSWSTTSGERDIAAEMIQNITDRTQQAAQSVRSRRASVVMEVSQKESETITTRTVTNYNHMHALTVQYYEVVQINRTVVELSKADRCVFVPMKPLNFSDTRIVDRFRMVIATASLKSSVRALALAEPGQTAFYAPARIGSWDAASLTALNSALGYSVGAPGDMMLIFPQSDFTISDMFFEKTTPFKDLIVTDSSGRTFQLALAVEDGEAGSPLIGTLHLASYKDMKLTELREVRARKKDGNKDYSGSARVGAFCFKDSESSYQMFYWNVNVPADSDSVVVFQAQQTIGSKELVRHLNDNRLYYSQAIWRSLDPATIGMMLSRYTWKVGNDVKPLVELVDPTPVSLVANYLVFKLSGDDEKAKAAWIEKKHIMVGSRTEDLVPVPSGGVFAEAVLGRFNSAEKLDITRFWNWQDSPIPIQAPDIAPVKADSRATAESATPSALGAPVLNIVNPPALPDPQGMGAVLAAIQNGNMFRDMSGLASTIGMAQAALAATQQGASNAAAQAGQNAAVAAQLNEKLTGALIQMLSSYLTGGKSLLSGGGGGGANPASLLGGISGQGARINQGKDMDKRGVGAGSGATTGSRPVTNSAAEPSPNESSAFRSALGVDGTDGALAQGETATGSTATDATNPDYPTTPSDLALLDSKLVTEPAFGDVTGFVFLMQAMDTRDLISLLIRRFETLDQTVDAVAKYNELVSEIQRRKTGLDNAEQMLFAAAYVKSGTLPDSTMFDAGAVGQIKEQALHLTTMRAFEEVARTVNPAAYDIVSSILDQAYRRQLCDINHISYILATAHHESNMGKDMEEIGDGRSTDTVFTRDAYFFNQIGGKNSYNGVNGNYLAGNQLRDAGIITEPDKVTLWNGKVYPANEPQDVKVAARDCDFYTFIGRGLVQVTGRGSYDRYSNRVETNNEDFVANPERITQPDNAAAILILGTEDGECGRGHKLSDYDSANTFDALKARDIVNGDRDHLPTKNGVPVGTETFGERVRRIAQAYKQALVLLPRLDESRRMI
jgi:hypothetical protein